MRIVNVIAIILFCSTGIFSQITITEGVVTYRASKNIYVRFENTENIKLQDTLYHSANGIWQPCMTVSQKSSSSCVCNVINDCEVEKNDVIAHRYSKEKTAPVVVEAQDSLLTPEEHTPIIEEEGAIDITRPYPERIRARISTATYSNFSSLENRDRHRAMTRFSLNANHINNSKFSIESYLNYRKNFVPGETPTDYRTSFFNIYNLAVTYDVDSTMQISAGRKINRKISSIGPVDGLQAEKYFGNFYTGGIIGLKPDLVNFGFNTDLLEYGGYIGYQKYGDKVRAQMTVGLLEQKNGAAIDRRYAYLQQSTSLSRDLNLFSSIEVDLYQNINGVQSTSPRLTNLFVSARYYVSRKLSFTVSYDSRKRIIYYETLRTEIEDILADDQARQGIRGRVNFRPIKYMSIGLSYSKRFQNDNQNKSDNMNGSISYSKLPGIGGRLSMNYNVNSSNYLESNIISVRHSRSIIKKKLNGDFYYRNVQYQYINSELSSRQQYIGGNFSLRLTKTLRFSLLGEVAVRESQNNIRINTKLIKRFDTK